MGGSPLIPDDVNTPVPSPPTDNIAQDVTDDDLEAALTTICDKFTEEDRPTWDNLTKENRRLILMWHGFQRLAWSEVSKDWKTPQQVAESENVDIDPDDYSRNINIYKAYGESIVAAASGSIPKVRFFPKDANNPNDIIASKEFTKASELIQQNNSVKLILLKANYIRFNSFYVAFYNYHHESEEYGTNKVPNYGLVPQESTHGTCPTCQTPVDTAAPTNTDGSVSCDYCGQSGIPEPQTTQDIGIGIIDFDEEPIGREVIEVYSPLHVKIAPYVRKLRDSPYLRLETEQHYTKLRDLYPEIEKDISESPDTGNSYRYSRESVYESGLRTGLNTVYRWWLRPFTYNILLEDDPVRIYLENNYPDGIHVVFIEDKLAEVKAEGIEEHWTIQESVTAETIIADPLGAPLAPIQDMKNDLMDLSIQTVDHGIGETFADPNVLDFDQYRKTEAQPGLIFPAVAPIGKTLDAGFYQIRAATLSKEVPDLDDRLTEYGQLAVGAFPSIYGGFAEGGSKTLGEYQASKNQALQRLTIPWEETNAAWAKVIKKCVLSMKKYMKDDTHMVQPAGNSFQNITVKKDDLMNGDIGHVDTENSDQFPISWPERRDLLMQLIGSKDERILSAIFDPNNAGEVARTIGFQNFHIPGEKDRNKQLWEISELVKAGPQQPQIQPNGAMGMPTPTIATEEFIDDHIVHIQVIKDWAISPEGLEQREKNTQGYLNVMAHLMQHIQYATPPPQASPGGDPNNPNGPPSPPQGNQGPPQNPAQPPQGQ